VRERLDLRCTNREVRVEEMSQPNAIGF
jgi:hypothetical protein